MSIPVDHPIVVWHVARYHADHPARDRDSPMEYESGSAKSGEKRISLCPNKGWHLRLRNWMLSGD
jgi:hypothetical protein